jgi:6-pyruvoyl tetrahydropterin synthase/QueD family protein
MKYEISQRFFFDAAHSLRRTIEVESSARIHGHTYQAEVALSGTPDPATGMVFDLGLLRAELDRIRAQLDHRLLDDVPGIGAPTLENLCSFIARALAENGMRANRVSVWREGIGDRCNLQLA